MKKLSYFAFAFISLIAAATNSTSYAVNRAGAATFSLGGGYEMFSSKRHINNTGVLSGAVGYNLTNNWGAEAFLGFFNTDSKYASDTRNVDGTLFAFDAVYHFMPSKTVSPYLMAGPGFSSINPNGTDAHTEGNVNAGAGVQVFIDRDAAFKFEARDFYTISDTKNDVLLSAGISFLLDIC